MNQNVIMYHDVYSKSINESGFKTRGANHYKISEETLIDQIRKIKNFEVVYTFDDGGISFYNIIAPLLEKNGLYGHFFIATDFIGTDGFMNEKQIRDLCRRGHIIGSHSASHPADFRQLPYENRYKEWKKSIERLSDLIKKTVDEISIPNGFLIDEDLPMFEQMNIKTIYTSKIGELRQYNDIQIIGRIAINQNISIFEIKKILSGGITYKKLIMRQKILQFTKSILGQNYVNIKREIRKWLK